MPVATLVSLLLMGVPTLVQLTVRPGLLGAWERNWQLLLDGQW